MVNSVQLDEVFSALADPTRRRIVERLARGPLTVGEIASGFAISQPAISRHVRVLEESGLLDRHVSGRVHRCTLSPKVMTAASAWIDKQRAFWNATLDRLGDLLEESPQRK
jgi:DNA-binding transcriptional ArsR family regulator